MKRVTVRIPGSSANLGPGFDALGLALKVHTTLTFDLPDEENADIPLVSLQGEIASSLPSDRSNLVHRILTSHWRGSPEALRRVRITIDSHIPLSRGLGSSASATLGTLWACRALLDEPVDRDELLSEAAACEGHPDNVAASLYGGLAVCGRRPGDNRVAVARLAWPEEWCTIVVVPPYPLATSKAREVLPAAVPLADAVFNIQNVALLVAAVTAKDAHAMNNALHDRIHEPYRAPLVPELADLRNELESLPAIGCVLSGAGSSVLVVVERKNKSQILEFLSNWCKEGKTDVQVLDLEVSQDGIEQIK